MKKAKKTSPQERLEIVKDCLARERNYGETARRYGCSYQQVRNWVQKYETMGGSRPGGPEGEADRHPAAPHPGRGMGGTDRAAGTGEESAADGE